MKAAYTSENMWHSEGRKHGSMVAKEVVNNRHHLILVRVLTYHLEKKANTFDIRQKMARTVETHRGRDVSAVKELRTVLEQR
jgi:hypothetical protein